MAQTVTIRYLSGAPTIVVISMHSGFVPVYLSRPLHFAAAGMHPRSHSYLKGPSLSSQSTYVTKYEVSYCTYIMNANRGSESRKMGILWLMTSTGHGLGCVFTDPAYILFYPQQFRP